LRQTVGERFLGVSEVRVFSNEFDLQKDTSRRKFVRRVFSRHALLIIYLVTTELFAIARERLRSVIANKISRRKSWTTSVVKSCCKKIADNYNHCPSLKSDDCQERRIEGRLWLKLRCLKALMLFRYDPGALDFGIACPDHAYNLRSAILGDLPD
jgi:hypothetical protein